MKGVKDVWVKVVFIDRWEGKSLANFTEVVLYRIDQDSHVLRLAYGVIDHPILRRCALLFALAAVWLIAACAGFAVNVAAF